MCEPEDDAVVERRPRGAAVLTGGDVESREFVYDDGVAAERVEVEVNLPPVKFELEAFSPGGPPAKATTTVRRAPDQHVYYRELEVRNPAESGRTVDVVVDGPGGRQQVATLSPGERTVIDESELSNCVEYQLEATDADGNLTWVRQFVFLSNSYTIGWSLPAES